MRRATAFGGILVLPALAILMLVPVRRDIIHRTPHDVDRGHMVSSPTVSDAKPQGPSGLRMVGQVGGRTEGVAVQGAHAYVAVGLRLVVLDVSEPITPTQIGSTAPFPQFVEGVGVSGAVAYVADGMAGLRLVDVSDPSDPLEIGAYDTPGYAESVAVVEGTPPGHTYAYVADGHYGLRIVDVSDPAKPAEVGYACPLNYVFDVAVEGQYAYLAAAGAGLLVVDVSDPSHPVEIGSLNTPGYAYSIDVHGDTAYVADGWEHVQVIDVSEPAHPGELTACQTPGWAFGVDIEDDVLYVADAFAGLQLVDVSDPARPARLGAYEIPDGHAERVVVVGETAYVADLNSGLRIVDVSDPGDPDQVGSYEPLGYATALAVAGDHAYVATATQGMRVVDVSDPASPVEVGTYGIQGKAVGVAMADGYACVAVMCPDVGAGLHVVDISEPAHPTRASFRPEVTGCYRDIAAAGRTAYVANEWGLELIDVSTPTTPTLFSFVDLQGEEEWGATTGVDVSGALAYVAGDNGLSIVDVSDPISPKLIERSEAFGHLLDVAVAGSMAYVTGGGTCLKVIDISDPSDLIQVGKHCGIHIPERVVVVDDVAYVSFGTAGVYGLDVTEPLSPTLAFAYDTAGYAYSSIPVGDHLHVADAQGGLVVLGDEGQRFECSQQVRAGSLGVEEEASYLDRESPPAGVGRRLLVHRYRGRAINPSSPSDSRPPVQVSHVPVSCVVTDTADSGPGTLRACTENAGSGRMITFDPDVFPPGDPATITLQSDLPSIWQGHVTIDASDAGVVLDGSHVKDGTGISIFSSHNVVRGLQIVHFSNAGVLIATGAMSNTIGGDRTLGAGPVGQGNVISDNGVGVGIDGNHNRIMGNFIGTDVTGRHALGNAYDGVGIAIGDGNIVGGPAPGEGNVISASGWNGVHLVVHADGNSFINNYIGTDVSGTVAMGNERDGVLMELSSGRNTIAHNLISGNHVAGVRVSDQESSYNVIVGNLIGTDADGNLPLGNAGGGVALGYGGSRFNRVGGTAPEDGNLIGGNDAGIELHGREAGNLILGNFIGTDIGGTQAIGNGTGIAVIDDSSRNFIGGATPAEGNLISGNDVGVNLMPAERLFILGNYIGTDVSGTVALANQESGIVSGGATHSVIQGNVVSGNGQAGVRLDSGDRNHLRANLIGVAAGAAEPLPNGSDGVRVWGPSNTLGGPYPEDGNVIAHNGNVGVQIWACPHNTIRRNAIYANAGAGIYLVNGGNDLLPAPIITAVDLSGVTGTACPGCIVELFSDEEDEGRLYEGTTVAGTGGDWTWNGRPSGPFVTATATDGPGNTSAFSAPQGLPQRQVYLPLVVKGEE
jgi:parallel beta-helix repeat protein